MPGRLDRKTFVTTLGAAGLGLGLAARGGPTVTQAQAPTTPAPDAGTAQGAGPRDDELQRREAFYTDFTAALADQLAGLNQSGRQPRQSDMGGMHGGNMQGGEGGEGGDRPADQGSMHGGGTPGGRQPDQADMQGSTQAGGIPSGAEAVDAAIRQALMAVLDSWQSSGRVTYGQAAAMKTLVATSPAPIAPSGLGPVLFGASAGVLRPAPAGPTGSQAGDGMAGEVAGGARTGAQSGSPASASGAAGDAREPDQDEPGERHGRRRR